MEDFMQIAYERMLEKELRRAEEVMRVLKSVLETNELPPECVDTIEVKRPTEYTDNASR